MGRVKGQTRDALRSSAHTSTRDLQSTKHSQVTAVISNNFHASTCRSPSLYGLLYESDLLIDLLYQPGNQPSLGLVQIWRLLEHQCINI